MIPVSSDHAHRQTPSRLRRTRTGRGRRAGQPSRRPELERLEARSLLTGTWTPLAHAAPSPDGIGTMMLLSDGTVMAQGGGVDKTWYHLTPDSSGSYANGTWSQLASMGLQRLYFGSNVLQDGRVFVVGGEYSGSGGAQNFTNTGEIYNPVTNSWTSILNFPRSQFGDDPTEVLPNGNVLTGYVSGPQTYIYHPATNTWTQTGTKLRSDQSDEEAWVKLPDDSILSYDVFSSISSGVGHAQRYIPSTGQWVDAGTVPVQLSSPAVGYELGPGFLLPDGRVFYLGANGKTAYYTPSANSWAAGPDIPNGMGADDAPGAMMPNGKILFAADRPLFNAPTAIFEFDPTANTYTDVTPAGYGLAGAASYTERMLVLPTGQVLLTNSSDQLEVYTPDGSADPSWAPQISAVTANGDGSFTLTGTQLNGISEGASYGDDAEMSSNYPLVRLTDAAGDVAYARTFNWSSTGVATGNTPVSTKFQLPRGLAPGELYALSVVANGIASDPVPFVIGQGGPYVTSFSPSGGVLPASQLGQSINVDFNSAATDFTSNFTVHNNGGANNTSLAWGATLGVQDQPGPASGGGVQSGGGVTVDSTAVYTPSTVNLSDGRIHTISEYVTAVSGLGSADKPLQIGFLAPSSTGFNAGFSFISARILANGSVEFQDNNGGPVATSINNTKPTGAINTGDWLKLVFTTQETALGSFGGTFSLVDYGPTGVDTGTTVLAPVSYSVSGLTNMGTASAVSPGFRTATSRVFTGHVQFDNFAVDQQPLNPVLHVTFDRPIDESTFTTASIDSFTGPGGTDLRGLVAGIQSVPGSNGQEFNIFLAQPLTTTGSYTITLGPNIDDTSGNPMDQNGNYMPGEVPGDEFTTSFSVLGPKITASTPSGSQAPGVADLFVTFNEPMDPSTFDPSDVILTGPGGPIAVNGVTQVAGSNGTRFDISFAPQAAVGSYRAVIGPDVRDPFGNEMDQNNNGVTGEVPGDQYVATFSVFGPKITASTPTGLTGGPVGDILVTFNEPMDPSTFDPSDVILTGPGGPIAVNGVAPVAGSNGTRFDISFAPQTALGSYRAVIGPDVRDPFGNEMDQNNNGITGEVPGDQYVATFSVIHLVNYQAQADPSNFVELAGDPNAFTIITSADDESDPVNLGSSTFTFYNATYTGNNQLFVSSNGLITFGSANSDFVNTNLTNGNPPQAAIAPLWSDWIGSSVNTASNPMVLGKFTTFRGSPALVVEWNQVSTFGGSPMTISFEAILMLNTGSAPGDVVFEYANLDTGDLSRNGAAATVGIKDIGNQPATGGNLLLISYNNGNNPLVQSGSAIRISVAGPAADAGTQLVDPVNDPAAAPDVPVPSDGEPVDSGSGGDDASPADLAVVKATPVPGAWDASATPADAARGALFDRALADVASGGSGLASFGLTRLGRRYAKWLGT